MSKISDKLNIISSAKDDIKTAIENKGVSVGDIGIQEYASKINKMEVSTPIEKGVILNEFDVDGYVTKATAVGLSVIPSYHFKNNNATSGFFKNLKELDLSDNVSSIQSGGVQYCAQLEKVHLSDVLESIGSSCFYSCTRLPLTDLPPTLKSIGSSAFYGCSKLAIKEIPEGVTKIESSVFYNCSNSEFKELTIKGDITSIESSAFGSCSYLEKLVLPNVTSVPTLSSTSAFSGTKIKYGTGYIYLPDTLVEEAKNSTNWSTYADQIKGVSEL